MKTPIIALLVALLIVIFWPRQHHQPSADQSSKPPRLEADFQRIWCDQYGAQNGLTLPDGTEADAVWGEYIIEHDFARKWYEGIGQALHYARVSGMKPGLVLILKSQNDLKYWERAVMLRDWLHQNGGPWIELWAMDATK